MRFCSKKVRAQPQGCREASPASHSRVEGARDEPALKWRDHARLLPLLTQARAPKPHGIFWKGRGSSKGREGGRGITVGRNFCCSWACPVPSRGSLLRESCLQVGQLAHADLSPASLVVSLRPAATQEANSEKTNNGIHYRLQLLYSNGEARVGSAPAPRGPGWGQGAQEDQADQSPAHTPWSAVPGVTRPLLSFAWGGFTQEGPEWPEGGRGGLALTWGQVWSPGPHRANSFLPPIPKGGLAQTPGPKPLGSGSYSNHGLAPRGLARRGAPS